MKKRRRPLPDGVSQPQLFDASSASVSGAKPSLGLCYVMGPAYHQWVHTSVSNMMVCKRCGATTQSVFVGRMPHGS